MAHRMCAVYVYTQRPLRDELAMSAANGRLARHHVCGARGTYVNLVLEEANAQVVKQRRRVQVHHLSVVRIVHAAGVILAVRREGLVKREDSLLAGFLLYTSAATPCATSRRRRRRRRRQYAGARKIPRTLATVVPG